MSNSPMMVMSGWAVLILYPAMVLTVLLLSFGLTIKSHKYIESRKQIMEERDAWRSCTRTLLIGESSVKFCLR